MQVMYSLVQQVIIGSLLFADTVWRDRHVTCFHETYSLAAETEIKQIT